MDRNLYFDDIDDIIQYHAQNLYRLFYRRKEQSKEYITLKEKVKKYNKTYYLKNKEKFKEYRKKYYLKNKEKRKAYVKEYRLKKKLEKKIRSKNIYQI